MPTTLTENLFASKYKDDYQDSHGFHRILFNPRRALQARELIQLQTIIQKEIERFGKNIFKEGAAVNPGGLVINSNYEFIKITDATFPQDIKGTEFTGQTSGVIVKILETFAAAGSDPNTLYVRYTNSIAGTSGTAPIRVTPGEQLSSNVGASSMTVQTVNTATNPAVGAGVRVSIGASDFFVQGFFVSVDAQSLIISKYDKSKTVDIGFKITQDIVSVDDDVNLFDNQGATLNQTAPGADRFRIKLLLVTQDSIVAGETFVPIAKIENSRIIETNNGQNSYNRINDIIAQRTKEESGNYIVNPFTVSYDSADASNLQLTVSEGTAYVNGYRVNSPTPTKITVPRNNDTIQFNNQPVSIAFGNFVIASSAKISADMISAHTKLNISTHASNPSGSIIGSARVRSLEKLTDGTFKVFLFDVKINSGSNFRSARTIGTSAAQVFVLKTKTDTNNNVVAELNEADNESLLFKLPSVRPFSISDVDVAVQRVFQGTTDSIGELGLTLTEPGETFTLTSDWLSFRSDSGPEITMPSLPTGNATSSSRVSTNMPGKQITVFGYVFKAFAAPKGKSITSRTVTGAAAVESDGMGNSITALGLGANDIISITSINKDSAGGPDVAHMYDLDDGQRDAYYQQGKVVLKSDFSNPGNVVVVCQHYDHATSGDFYNVNSYNTTKYSEIPEFTSKTGEVFKLRDVFDFRPSKDVNGDFTGSGHRIIGLPKNTTTLTSDPLYFMPRNDKITITETGEIKVIQGSSSLTPKFPETPANSLELYRVKMGANTLNGEDVSYDLIEAKGFTMKDIGKIEKRVERIEELHSLSILELDTNKLSVTDSAGNERVKVGFSVDNFKDQSQSAITSSQYSASIDPKDHSLHPAYYENNVGLVYDSNDTDTSGVVRKGDNVYIDFIDSAEIEQLQVSKAIDINSFDIFQFNGHIKLSPSSDDFRDKLKSGTKSISGANTLSKDENTLWESWKWNWIGTSFDGTVTEEEAQQVSNTRSFGHHTSQLLNSGLESVEKTIVNRVVSSETIRKVIDDRVVDIAIVPFIRSRLVHFEAIGMRPNTRVFPFFDEVDVSAFCREETFSFHGADSDGTEFGNTQAAATTHPSGSTNLTTDAEGRVSGTFFIPNTPQISFRAGVREFKLLDITTSDETNASTRAVALYNSAGAIERNRTNVISTRHISVLGSDTNILSDRVIGTSDTRGRIDPLAQSFYVNNQTGMFVSSIDLFFKEKDADLPVWIQIMPIINGVPSREVIVPGSTKYLSPAGVNISTTGATPTTFQFDEPLFLDSFTEYVIAVQSDSKDYKIWAGKTGDLIVGSTQERVSKRTIIGALYLPQNTYKWEPIYDMDLKFRINRCKFTTGNHTAILNNATLPERLLPGNPIDVTSGSVEVKVNMKDHGLNVGDSVVLKNMGTIGGLAFGASQTVTITKISGDCYFFNAGGAATSTTSGGGLNVTSTVNYQYDLIVPYVENIIPQSTSITAQMKQTTGKSLAGAETPYTKDAAYSDITLKENNFLANPRVVTYAAKATKSAQMKVTLSSSNNYVSPVIDLQRSSLVLVGNRIDNQANSAAAGFNVPYPYVEETDKTAGTHLSKHITKPVTLLSDAVGLKVLLSANRPSVADFDVYYKAITEDQILDNISWTLAPKVTNVPSDENKDVFREYTYLIGGDNGSLLPFTTFQLKIVMRTSNSSSVPIIKDLRAIALGV